MLSAVDRCVYRCHAAVDNKLNVQGGVLSDLRSVLTGWPDGVVLTQAESRSGPRHEMPLTDVPNRYFEVPEAPLPAPGQTFRNPIRACRLTAVGCRWAAPSDRFRC